MDDIEFIYQDLPLRIQREEFEGRVIHDLYYRRHFLKSFRTEPDTPESEIVAFLQGWIEENPVDPYECVGGPYDGDLLSDRGDAFAPAEALGRYERVGLKYRWTQASS